MTADTWLVETTKASFLRVTAHWIKVKDNKWKLWVEVIGFRPLFGEHSGPNLAQYFMGVCECIGIITAQRLNLKVTRVDHSAEKSSCKTAKRPATGPDR